VSEKSSVLFLRGLPYAATKEQIRDFFEGIEIGIFVSFFCCCFYQFKTYSQ
jgi:RNA recognition motif-containing protein